MLLREFSVRRNSGGKGKHTGGNGVTREIEFLKDDFSAGILSERRAFGMNETSVAHALSTKRN